MINFLENNFALINRYWFEKQIWNDNPWGFYDIRLD